MIRFFAGALLAAWLCGGALGAKEQMVIDGSSTVGPIAKAFAEYYMEQEPKVRITVNESGSGNGAKAIMSGKCDIATLSRFMKEKEFKAAVDAGRMPTAHAVALDGVAMIIHPSNSVKNLTLDQVRAIYAGKIKNWRELGGPNATIVAISRDTSSGTYETFSKLAMRGERIGAGVESVGSNGQMRARTQSTRGAIGYVSLGFLDRTVKAITVNNIPATRRAIVSGLYPIARALYMFTDGYPKLGSHVFRYINLYKTPAGQEILTRRGFVPFTTY